MTQTRKNTTQQVDSKSEGKGDGNRPVKSFHLRGVRVSVFANPTKVEGRDAVFHKVSLTRTYKDDNGEFKSTPSLGRDDLPVAQLLMGRAWEWILETEAQARREEQE